MPKRLVAVLLSITALFSGAVAQLVVDVDSGDAVRNQLSGSHVSNVLQDKLGFIWLATWNGLMRYDGTMFHTFEPIASSEGSIDSNRIYNIKFSSTGDLWCVSTDNRLFRFTPGDGMFENLSFAIPEFNALKVKNLVPLKRGSALWVAFKEGTIARLSDSLPLTSYNVWNGIGKLVPRATRFYSVAIRADNGNEVVLTDAGALDYNQRRLIRGNFKFHESVEGHDFLVEPGGRVVDMQTLKSYRIPWKTRIRHLRKSASCLVFATDDGVVTFDARNGRFQKISATPVEYLFKDSRGRIWGLNAGNSVTYIADSVNMSVKVLETPLADSEPLTNPPLALETTSGEVLLKPGSSPLCSYEESTGRMNAVKNIKGENYTPSKIKKFLHDSGDRLWVFRDAGVDCLRFYRDRTERYNSPDGSEVRAIGVAPNDSVVVGIAGFGIIGSGLSERVKRPYAIAFQENQMIVGTKGDGLVVLDSRRGRHDIRRGGLENLPCDTIYSLLPFGDNVLVGSYGQGISVLNKNCKVEPLLGQREGMKVRSMLVTKDSVLLAGTTEGLFVSDALRYPNKVKSFLNSYNPAPWGLKGNDVMAVQECDGELFVGVYGAGLYKVQSDDFLQDSIHFSRVPMPIADGNDNELLTMKSLGRRLLVVTRSRLLLYTPENDAAAVVDVSSPGGGILTFTEAAPALLSDGRVAVATTSGYIVVDVDALTAEAQRERVVLAGMLRQGETMPSPLYNPSSLKIPVDQRSFSLIFSSPDGKVGSSPRLRYRVEGVDNEWNYTRVGAAAATYNNFPPGKYSLEVEVLDMNGEWSKALEPIELEVEPAWNERPAVRIAFVLAVIGLIIILFIAVARYRRLSQALQAKYSLLMAIDRITKAVTKKNDNKASATAEADSDEDFLKKSVEFLDSNIDNSELLVEDFAKHLRVSRTAFYNRMKSVTGLSPVDFIRQLRIKRALPMLKDERLSVAEIAYQVGFADPKYFSRCFKKEMGVTPTAYRENPLDTKGAVSPI